MGKKRRMERRRRKRRRERINKTQRIERKRWAGSVKGNIGLLQVNVNFDLINTKPC